MLAARKGVLSERRSSGWRTPKRMSLCRWAFRSRSANTSRLGPDRVRARLAEVGALTRTALADVTGWQVVEPVDEPSAITTLIPPDGLDPQTVRSWLIAERGVVTTYIGPERAPMELTRPALRISPHVDVSVGDLEVLADALSAAAAAN